MDHTCGLLRDCLLFMRGKEVMQNRGGPSNSFLSILGGVTVLNLAQGKDIQL